MRELIGRIPRYEARFRADGLLTVDDSVRSLLAWDYGPSLPHGTLGPRRSLPRTPGDRAGGAARRHGRAPGVPLLVDFATGYVLGRCLHFDSEEFGDRYTEMVAAHRVLSTDPDSPWLTVSWEQSAPDRSDHRGAEPGRRPGRAPIEWRAGRVLTGRGSLAQGVSQRNRDGKQSARERIKRARERERVSERRARGAKVAGVAVVLLAAAAAVGIIAANNGGSTSGATDAEPITVGSSDAPATLTVYEDFRCPACGTFEDNFRDTIGELTDSGKLRVEYHLVSIIDGNVGGSGSKAAANAAACSRDAGRFREYHDVLFEHQPAEQDDAFANTSHLIDLAGSVEGLDTDTFRSCVEDGSHDGWVSDSNAAFLNSDYNATPTILLNGENVYGDANNPLTPDSLRDRVNQLAD